MDYGTGIPIPVAGTAAEKLSQEGGCLDAM